MLRRPATPDAAPLPPDIRAMNLIAAGVSVLAVAALLAAGAGWVARRPFFSFADVRLEGELQRNNVSTVRANALPHLAGNFFTMDLQQARAAFEQVPWVRRAVVRRLWPNRLVVRLEEHQPVALWTGEESTDRLVNSHGEVFEANVGDVEDDGLPEFSGPEGSSPQVWSMYRRLKPVFAGLDAEVGTLSLSGRGSWRVELDNGATVELGRGSEDEVVDRTARFVRTVPAMLNKFHAPLETADLRHQDGYAVKLKGVAVAAAASAVPRNAVQVPVNAAQGLKD
jgi:cell division protein FtsQ